MSARSNTIKGREVSGGSLTVFKEDLARAVDLTADVCCNPTFESA